MDEKLRQGKAGRVTEFNEGITAQKNEETEPQS